MDCAKFCDLNSNFFKELCDKFSISNTHFIRTTDKKHKKIVHKIWTELDRRGFIYKTNYDGWYSINDETFIPNKQVRLIEVYINELNDLIIQQNETDENDEEVQNPKELLKFLHLQLNKTNKNSNEIRVDSKTGNLLEYSEESNYIFKLGNVKDRLIELIKNNHQFITPDRFRNKLLNMLDSDNLSDVSISRSKSRFSWGISVPNDDEQIVFFFLQNQQVLC